ncbi:hypothetical protein ACWEVP_46310 [Amycolatopsis sp. NPDC003865]
MHFEVENSGLTPADVAGVLPGPVERVSRGTGDRGPVVEVLIAVAENVAAGAITTGVTGLWMAWRKRRERDLKDFSSATVRVEVLGEDGSTETMVDLHGDGQDGARRLELEIGDRVDGGQVHRIRFTFPDE